MHWQLFVEPCPECWRGGMFIGKISCVNQNCLHSNDSKLLFYFKADYLMVYAAANSKFFSSRNHEVFPRSTNNHLRDHRYTKKNCHSHALMSKRRPPLNHRHTTHPPRNSKIPSESAKPTQAMKPQRRFLSYNVAAVLMGHCGWVQASIGQWVLAKLIKSRVNGVL